MPPPPTLRVRVRTPHGEPVTGARVVLAGPRRWIAREPGGGDYLLPLDTTGDHQLLVARLADAFGFDHRTLRATAWYRAPRVGEPPMLRFQAPPGEETGSLGPVEPTPEGFAVEVRLDYLWFTPVGTPPRRGNTVRVLIDGEAAWASVADAIEAARSTVHLTTWIYQPTAELRRPEPVSDPAERAVHTVQDLLERKAAEGVDVRLLLWDAPFVGLPPGVRKAEREAHDHFEVIQEANLVEGPLLRADEYPVLSRLLGDHPLWSFHQKTAVIDGVVGFCGGMNLKENDWDQPGHKLYAPERARFERPRAWRSRVAAALRRADHPPRHDLMARVEGPVVADLEANFAERWSRAREADPDAAARASTPPPPPRVPGSGPHAVQVVRTMPPPHAERGILDVHLRAIRAARRLIYIEDQYFRSTVISDALADAVRTWPELAVVVVTLRSYANDPLQGGWCWECFERVRERRPDFELYTLEVEDADRRGVLRRQEVDLHAKLMIVDDLFLTLGSCNLNDRGFELEGELNLAVVDEALARETRLRLWREHLDDDERLGKDLATDLATWRDHAERNRDLGGETFRVSHVVPFTPKPRPARFDRRVW